jgi:hypothetical protein
MPLGVRVVHVHVIRIFGSPRVLGGIPPGAGACRCRLGDLHRLGEGRRWEGFLRCQCAGAEARAGGRRSLIQRLGRLSRGRGWAWRHR